MTTNDFNNKTVVITRPIERSKALSDLITEYNGVPIIIPTLELQIVESDELKLMINNIDTYDWIIFTSPAGVKSFFNLYGNNIIPCKIAVIGTKSEEELLKYNNKADLIPDNFTAEGLLESFKSVDIKNKKIALPRTLSARTTLPEGLEEYGAKVDIAEAYTSGTPKDKTNMLKLIDMILNNEIDIITFTSPLTVKNLVKLVEHEDIFNKFLYNLQNNIIVGSIGPITGKVLNNYKINAIEPQKYTVKDMIETLIHYLN
ncbi:MAG: uroporphyrinogen-III synthase [Methanosphaera stadtmanae]|nr:uroporphyrinogen-III synthase [Methanosphaera stadtmanae]